MRRYQTWRVLSCGICRSVVCLNSATASEEHVTSTLFRKFNQRVGGTCHLHALPQIQPARRRNMSPPRSSTNSANASEEHVTSTLFRKFSQRVGGTCHLHALPKRWLTSSGLHGVISQKIELFITTAVRTSNPTHVISLSYLTKPSAWRLFSVDLSKYYLLRCLHNSFSLLENLLRYKVLKSIEAFKICLRVLQTLKTCSRSPG
jgi:hypothetical protein